MTSVVAPGVGSMRRLSRRGFSSGTIEVDDTGEDYFNEAR
jgi:hypothetical protein